MPPIEPFSIDIVHEKHSRWGSVIYPFTFFIFELKNFSFYILYRKRSNLMFLKYEFSRESLLWGDLKSIIEFYKASHIKKGKGVKVKEGDS